MSLPFLLFVSFLPSRQVLLGECLSGAMYVDDFRRIMADVGLSAWGICDARTIAIEKRRIRKQLGDVRFYSLTIRAVKPPAEKQLDDLPEDYGQVRVMSAMFVVCC